MKPFIVSSLALAAVVTVFFSVLMLRCWGWIGMVLYILFACLCLAPAAVKAWEIHKKGGWR